MAPCIPLSHSLLLSRTGLKERWVWAEALEAPHRLLGCCWPAPEAPAVSSFSSSGWDWQSYWGVPPSGTAVGEAGPQCLTISLAPVGIFLKMR